MPIYKIIKTSGGKIVKKRKNSPNNGGRVVGWKIDNVKGKPHKTYKSALQQLKAIQYYKTTTRKFKRKK